MCMVVDGKESNARLSNAASLRVPAFPPHAQWNPDGHRLITGSHTGEIGLWSAFNFLHEAGMQVSGASTFDE